MSYVIKDNRGRFYAGTVELKGNRGFAWTTDETDSDIVKFADRVVAIAEARTILHAALEVPLDEPGVIPSTDVFDVDVVEVEDAA